MTLHDLPLELLIMIISAIDSPLDLRALITASDPFYRVFSLSPERLLLAVLKNAILPENWRHALAVIHAPDAADSPQEEAEAITQSFLSGYFAGKSYNFPTQRGSIVNLSRLCIQVARFVNEYSAQAMRSLVALDPLCPSPAVRKTGYESRSNGESDISSTPTPSPLSYAERVRFQRAFFRFELYCRIFPVKPLEDESFSLPSSLFSADFQFQEFVAKIAPWELEEITCVHQYFMCLAAELVEDLENRVVRDVLCANGVRRPPDWAVSTSQRLKRRRRDSRFFDLSSFDVSEWEESVISARFSNPSDVEEIRHISPELTKMVRFNALDLGDLHLFSEEGRYGSFAILSILSSFGIDFMRNLLVTDEEGRKDIIMQQTIGRDFLPEAMNNLFNGSAAIAVESELHNDDSPSHSNPGWRSLKPPNTHAIYIFYDRHGLEYFPLRARGYIFWDAERIRSRWVWKKLNEAHNMSHRDVEVLFDRSQYRSVEERLEKVQLPEIERRRLERKYRSRFTLGIEGSFEDCSS